MTHGATTSTSATARNDTLRLPRSIRTQWPTGNFDQLPGGHHAIPLLTPIVTVRVRTLSISQFLGLFLGYRLMDSTAASNPDRKCSLTPASPGKQ